MVEKLSSNSYSPGVSSSRVDNQRDALILFKAASWTGVCYFCVVRESSFFEHHA